MGSRFESPFCTTSTIVSTTVSGLLRMLLRKLWTQAFAAFEQGVRYGEDAQM